MATIYLATAYTNDSNDGLITKTLGAFFKKEDAESKIAEARERYESTLTGLPSEKIFNTTFAITELEVL